MMKYFRMKCFPRRCRTILKVVVCLSLCSWFFYKSYNEPILYRYEVTYSDSKCLIPEVDPFDNSVQHLLQHPDAVVCNNGPELVSMSDDGVLCVNATNAVKANIDGFRCQFQHIQRDGDNKVKLGPVELFSNCTRLYGDFFLVTCKNAQEESVFERIIYHIDLNRTLSSRTDILPEGGEDLNVFVFLLDSVSRLAAERHLPKTMKFLRDDLKAFVFRGHHMLGEYSFENGIGIFIGATHAEVVNMGRPDGHFDDVKMIWKDFAKRGYVTMFSEDYTKHATFHPYLGKTFPNHGFKDLPTDHYMRPFFLAIEQLHPMGFYLNYARMFLEDKSKSFKFSNGSPFCYGNMPRHKHMIEFYRKFIHTYKGKRRFGLTWLNELAHDFSSYLELADNDLLEWLQWMKTNGHLDNTMLIMMADHGSRVGNVRNTRIGKLEFKMPLLTLALPEKFRKRHPRIVENLHNNTGVLTTHHDVYRTLKAVAELQFDVENDYENDQSKLKSRGISLFRRIPPNRTCKDALVHESLCTCYVTKDVDVRSHVVQKAAKAIVKEINNLLRPVKHQCATYKLNSVENAELVLPKYKEILKKQNALQSWIFPPTYSNERYSIILRTSPGNALFEGTVTSPDFRLLGPITRNSLYGNTSSCMVEKRLKEYCLCNEFVHA